MSDIVKADTDGQYYKTEDLEWVVLPGEMSPDDPGVLGPIQGAVPINQEESYAKGDCFY